jgi:hypothetical protein
MSNEELKKFLEEIRENDPELHDKLIFLLAICE